MKIATIIFAMFLGACLHVEAQSQGREHPSISKEVSRFRVSKHFYQAATVYTGHSLLSKDVQRLNFTEGKISKVRMTGTPSHVISKEIARLQHSK